MSNLLRIFVITLTLFSCAQNRTDNFNENRIFELYAKASLYEFCTKNMGYRCNKIKGNLDSINPEIFLSRNAEKKEVLVLFTLNNYHPHVIFGYDKDGDIEIRGTGIWITSKQEMVENFLKYGDPSYDPDYYD